MTFRLPISAFSSLKNKLKCYSLKFLYLHTMYLDNIHPSLITPASSSQDPRLRVLNCTPFFNIHLLIQPTEDSWCAHMCTGMESSMGTFGSKGHTAKENGLTLCQKPSTANIRNKMRVSTSHCYSRKYLRSWSNE